MKKRTLLVLLACIGMTACGYRGALYLPSEQPQQNQAEQPNGDETADEGRLPSREP